MTPPEFIIVGRVRKAHGIRGEVVVEVITDAPDAKTASGASVMTSTTTSPRMPCALRTRPTMMNAGGVI